MAQQEKRENTWKDVQVIQAKYKTLLQLNGDM